MPAIKKPAKPEAKPAVRGKTHVAGAEAPYQLPHERDESTNLPGPKRPVIEQAERDLASGQVDTDNYTRARGVTKRSLTPRKR
jgi:hypothetical protein